ARRGVAGGAGDALRAFAGGGVLADLLAAQLLRLGVEQLAGLLGDREVHVHGDLGVDPAAAGQRLEQLADALVVGGLLAADLLELDRAELGGAVVAVAADHAPALVDHGDPLRGQVRDRGGDQVGDRVDLVALQHGAGR